MTKILITGGNGQLGRALQKVLKDEEALFTDVEEMDFTNKKMVEKVFSEFKSEWLVHGGACTNVDGCEEDPELAKKVNQTGTEILAEACKKHNVRMIYISTDYVFDGKKREPYTEDDQTNPQSVYGETKLAGEKAVLKLPKSYVLRTSWVYGEGKNFVKTMLALSEKMDEIKVVNDQFGRPTYAEDLADAIYAAINTPPISGVYNVSNCGEIISWADFAYKIFEFKGINTKVTGISTDEYLSQYGGKKIAKRPGYSAFDLKKAKSFYLPVEWKTSLRDYLL
jgi:dTDP-4-dehydrorhamnose reductase